jgi:hypothetical protein
MASKFYYQNRASEAVGPVGLQELLEARAEGKLQDDLICPEGQSQWVKYESLFPPRSLTKATTSEFPARVKIVDIDMPFGSMVVFMIKWAVAAIPVFLFFFAFALAMLFLAGLLFGPFIAR